MRGVTGRHHERVGGRRRATAPATAALVLALLTGAAGCTTGAAVPGTPQAPAPSSAGSSAPRLTLDVALPAGSSLAGAAVGTAVAGVLGGVDDLPAETRRGADVYVGTLDSAVRVFVELPGTTAAQQQAAQRALVGRWSFAVRPVTSRSVDGRACIALTVTPQPDRVCDPATNQVLVLGDPLDVRADGARVLTSQGQDAVAIALSAATRPELRRWTAAHVGEQLAVTDGRGLVTAPTVQSAITTPEIVVQGGLTPLSAAALAGRVQLAAAGAVVTAAG